MATIGERIEELRKEKGLNRDELANELGVSSGTVAHWEQGVQIPGRDVYDFSKKRGRLRSQQED